MTSHKISAIILAGGQGRRFNYQDKGLILWRGKPLISHVIEQAKQQVEQIIINCNRNVEHYQQFTYPVSHDLLTDYQGPLAGIQSALALIKHDYTLVLPCDTPTLPNNLAQRLLTALIDNNADVAYPETQTRKHYLPALMRSKVLVSLNDYLCTENRSIRGWYRTLNAINVDFSCSEKDFLNVNSPDLL